jgi:hypothetical protein
VGELCPVALGSWRISELYDDRPPRYDLGASGEEVLSHYALKYTTFATRLASDDHYLGEVYVERNLGSAEDFLQFVDYGK